MVVIYTCPICGCEILEKEIKFIRKRTIWKCKGCQEIWENKEDLKKVESQTISLMQNGTDALILGKYQEALVYVNRIIEIDPEHADAWNLKGGVHKLLKEDQKAMECYDKVLNINPKRGDTWSNKGGIFAGWGEHKKALECYDKAIAIKSSEGRPDYVRWMIEYSKGKSYFKLKQFKEAIRCYDKALELNQNEKDVWKAKGNALKELNREKEAEECFKKFKELSERDVKL